MRYLNKESILKIMLLAIIPIGILGFNLFEETGFYSKLFKFTGVESALSEKLTTNFGGNHRMIILRDEDAREFDHLWNIVKKNCKKEIPSWTPIIISRSVVENGTFVTLPELGEVVLVPREVPVYALRYILEDINKRKKFDEDMFFIGTVGDIEKWLKESKANIRFIFDIIISIISIIIGILWEFNNKKTLKI